MDDKTVYVVSSAAPPSLFPGVSVNILFAFRRNSGGDLCKNKENSAAAAVLGMPRRKICISVVWCGLIVCCSCPLSLLCNARIFVDLGELVGHGRNL